MILKAANRFYLILFLSTFFVISTAWADSDCHKLSVPSLEVKECQLQIKSAYLNSLVYVKAWYPNEVNPDTPVILFLHGRGYSLPKDSTQPTMIEAAGLEQWIRSEAFKKNPALVLSPQDLFIREDGTGKGNDYWIGAEGRNWEGFIINELKPLITNELSFSPQKKWLAAGISMGAHGSMKMALDYPEHFKAFVSLSPVFRSTGEELENIDKPVFFQYGDLQKTSLGARFIHNTQTFNQLDNTPHWIEIHNKDFALGDKFKASQTIWEHIENNPTTNAVAPINAVPLDNPGHSMDFWRLRLPEALTWLITE